MARRKLEDGEATGEALVLGGGALDDGAIALDPDRGDALRYPAAEDPHAGVLGPLGDGV